jgi:hypothetical protein
MDWRAINRVIRKAVDTVTIRLRLPRKSSREYRILIERILNRHRKNRNMNKNGRINRYTGSEFGLVKKTKTDRAKTEADRIM